MWTCTGKTILIDGDLSHGEPKWLLADCAVVFSTMILLVSRDRKVSSNRNGIKKKKVYFNYVYVSLCTC